MNISEPEEPLIHSDRKLQIGRTYLLQGTGLSSYSFITRKKAVYVGTTDDQIFLDIENCAIFRGKWTTSRNVDKGEYPWSVYYGGMRVDGFHFFLLVRGRQIIINAGCRFFTTLNEARAWWQTRQRDDIPTVQHRTTNTSDPFNRWSLAAVDLFERTLDLNYPCKFWS